MAIPVPNESIRGHAERLVTGSVDRGALALAFSESTASSAEVLVGGPSFYPPMLDDIRGASSSVHINQFGFRPGKIGDAFAEALVAKARGRRPRSTRRRPERLGPGRVFTGVLRPPPAAGVQVCTTRATKLRVPAGPLGSDGPVRWNLGALGHIDHRKVIVVDGRTGWIGGAGIEDHFHDGRFHDLFVRVAGPVVAQLQLVFLASFRWLGGDVPAGELDNLFPSQNDGADPVPAVVLHNAPGKLPADHRCDRAPARERHGDARRRQPVRHRPRDDPAHRARRSARRARPPVRSREREQLGLRGRPAAPPREAARRRRSHPRVPADAAREGVRAGRGGAARRDLQSRGLEPEALLRDRPPASIEGSRAQFDERFCAPAEAVSSPGRRLTGTKERARARVFATLSPLL